MAYQDKKLASLRRASGRDYYDVKTPLFGDIEQNYDTMMLIVSQADSLDEMASDIDELEESLRDPTHELQEKKEMMAKLSDDFGRTVWDDYYSEVDRRAILEHESYGLEPGERVPSYAMLPSAMKSVVRSRYALLAADQAHDLLNEEDI